MSSNKRLFERQRALDAARILAMHPAATAICPRCINKLLRTEDGFARKTAHLITVERFMWCEACTFKEALLMNRPKSWMLFPELRSGIPICCPTENPIYEAHPAPAGGWRLITWIDGRGEHSSHSLAAKRWSAIRTAAGLTLNERIDCASTKFDHHS